MDASTLLPVDETWDRALAVVAHPDDMEFGAAAAVARWTAQGKTVVYCMVTSGEAGIDSLDPARARQVREREQIESARIVGVDVVDFLQLPDGVLEYGVALRRAICLAVRRHRPEIVITNNFHDTWGGRSLNQADHIATGRATLDAVRDAGNRWIFHDQLGASANGDSGSGSSGEGGGGGSESGSGLQPWGGVRQVWAAGSPLAQHAADTSATFDLGVRSLMAHRAYIDGLGWKHFDPAAFLAQASEPAGARLGTRYAATFEVFPMGWGD